MHWLYKPRLPEDRDKEEDKDENTDGDSPEVYPVTVKRVFGNHHVIHHPANAQRNLLFCLNDLLSICHVMCGVFSVFLVAKTKLFISFHRNKIISFRFLPGPGPVSPGRPHTCQQWGPGWWTSPSPPRMSPGHCCPRWAAEKQTEHLLQINEAGWDLMWWTFFMWHLS